MDIFEYTKKYFFIALIVCGFAFIFSVGLYIFIGKQNERARELRAELSVVGIEDVVTLKRSLRMFEAYDTELDTLVVDKDALFVFIDDLDQLAQQGGAQVSIQTVVVEDVGNDGKKYKDGELSSEQHSHGILTIAMRVEGNWDAVMNFLLQLETLPRKTDITNLRLSSVQNRETGGFTWNALFGITTVVE